MFSFKACQQKAGTASAFYSAVAEERDKRQFLIQMSQRAT
jgi:hypothetical protein